MMLSMIMPIALRLTAYICTLVVLTEAYMSRIDQCEPIEIPRCRAMPYNMTQMPNLMHHNTQENARLVFERFEVLLDQNCSDSLLFLLCSIHVPICAVSLQPEAIPPCRSVCEKARAGCEPLMNAYNVSWPESLECSKLPRYERGVCVSPEAFVKPSKPKKGCSRCKRKRPTWSNMRKYKYDYAVKVQIQRGKRVSATEMMYKVKLNQVIFSGEAVKFQTASDLTLWVNTSCACPKFHKGRDYLVMGHAEGAVSKLLISPVAVATSWKEAQVTQISKWHSRLTTKTEKSPLKKKKNIQTEKKKKKNKEQATSSPLPVPKEKPGRAKPANVKPGPNAKPPGSVVKPATNVKRANPKPTNPKPVNPKPANPKPAVDSSKTMESSTLTNLSDILNGYTHGGRYYTKELAKKYNQATMRAGRT